MAHVEDRDGPSVSEEAAREEMCDIGRRIWLRGMCAGNEGNHSCRIGEDRVLCTPTAVSKGFLKPDDICTVDMEGRQVAGKRKRTSEVLMHLAIYRARPDVRAVVHSHPPHATAFAIAGVELPTCIHPEAEIFLGAVKMVKYVTPGDARLGESLLPYVKDANTLLLQNHGTVTFDADLENAYYKLEIVDAYARVLLLAKGIGTIAVLDPAQMKELMVLKERFGLRDPRLGPGGTGLVYSTDFLSRVGGDVTTKGRPQSALTPSPPTSARISSLEHVVHTLVPRGGYGESDIEALVQTITDQIMASGSWSTKGTKEHE